MIYVDKPKDFKPKFEISFCICTYNDSLLFLQRQDHKPQGNQWGVPAGKIENSETPVQGAKRELVEETGIDLPESHFNFIEKVYDKFPTLGFIVHIFHVRLSERMTIKINPDEHKVFKWVTLEEALTMDYMQDVDELLKLAFKKITVTIN